MGNDNHDITILLERMAEGDRDAESRLYELVMPDLRRIAHHLMGGERPNHTLRATELISNMYVRLAGSNISLRNRGHFFALAARVMRRELIDYARKRPKAQFLPMDGFPKDVLGKVDNLDLILTIDELIDRMREPLPVECSIVELKFFLGMTDEETAEILDLPLRTMQLRWQDARIWLFERAESQEWKPAKPKRKPATN